MIGKRNAHALRLSGVSKQTQKAAARLTDGVIARHITVWTRLAKTRNRTVNDFTVHRLDLVVSQAAFFQSSGPKVFDENIRIREELEHKLPRLILPQI